MTITRLIRWLLALFIVGTLLWKLAPLPSRTLVFADQNCQCAVPYNWTLKENPGFLVDAHRFYGGTFTLKVVPVSSSLHVDDPSYMQSFKNKLETDGYEVMSENNAPFEGRVTYTNTARKTIGGMLIYVHSVNFVAGKSIYFLDIAKINNDPVNDAQLLAAVNSFKLLSPAP
jgi:hypothetical protein